MIHSFHQVSIQIQYNLCMLGVFVQMIELVTLETEKIYFLHGFKFHYIIIQFYPHKDLVLLIFLMHHHTALKVFHLFYYHQTV